MGCEESQISKIVVSDSDIPEKEIKHLKKKKNQLEPLHGKIPDDTVFENVKKIDKVKTPEDLDFIIRTISKHFLLFKLSKHERK